jgi:hypothetical protein
MLRRQKSILYFGTAPDTEPEDVAFHTANTTFIYPFTKQEDSQYHPSKQETTLLPHSTTLGALFSTETSNTITQTSIGIYDLSVPSFSLVLYNIVYNTCPLQFSFPLHLFLLFQTPLFPHWASMGIKTERCQA